MLGSWAHATQHGRIRFLASKHQSLYSSLTKSVHSLQAAEHLQYSTEWAEGRNLRTKIVITRHLKRMQKQIPLLVSNHVSPQCRSRGQFVFILWKRINETTTANDKVDLALLGTLQIGWILHGPPTGHINIINTCQIVGKKINKTTESLNNSRMTTKALFARAHHSKCDIQWKVSSRTNPRIHLLLSKMVSGLLIFACVHCVRSFKYLCILHIRW